MKINEAKKIMKKETTGEREEAFYTLYGVKTQKDVLEQFRVKVTALKVIPFSNKRMSEKRVQEEIKAQYKEQYIKLLELILEYSHAMFFLYSKDRINKNFSAYKKVAIESIKSENVENAFKQFKRLYNYQEPTGEPTKKEEPTIVINNNCLALGHINNLKSDLGKDLKVMGGSVDDKKAYIRFAIISLATGATANDITDIEYQIEGNNSIYDFDYIKGLISDIREYQQTRATPLSERGIRNGIDNLKLPMSKGLHEKIDKKYSHCRNFNHLIYLYRECKISKKP